MRLWTLGLKAGLGLQKAAEGHYEKFSSSSLNVNKIDAQLIECPLWLYFCSFCISPAQSFSKFLFTILNFYTYKSTSVPPQALMLIFKIEFWVVTAIGTTASGVAQREA